MNKLDKYIIVNYVKSFFLGMMIFFLIFIMAESINITGWIMDGKMNIKDALKYLLYGVPEIITNTAPLGILLGSLLCISKMAKQLEVAAMKTSGISFSRVVKFPVLFSLLVSLVVLFMNYDTLGKANSKKDNLKAEKVSNEPVYKNEKEFVLVKVSKDKILYSGYVNKTEGIMKDIEIIEMEKGFQGVKTIHTASSAKIDKRTNIWTFENLKGIDGKKNSSMPIDVKNFKFVASLDDIMASPVKAKNLTMPELREKVVYFTRVGADSLDLRIDFYYRIAFAMSSFVMCFIGLSLGSKFVRGGAAVNIGISVLIGYAYYGITTILRSVAGSGVIPIYLACFLPLIIFLFVGLYLFKNAEY